jgi:hypothetical protein
LWCSLARTTFVPLTMAGLEQVRLCGIE